VSVGKTLLLGIGAALVIALLGAALVYFVKTSTQQQFDAYRRHGDSLATVQAQALQRHEDSALAQIGLLVQSSAVHASQGQQRDTVIRLDSATNAGLRADLALARTALDSLLKYPKLVSADSGQIVNLTSARNSWRSAFNDQAQANAQLVGLHASDTAFRAELLAQIKALPKPPRGSLWSFLSHPKPYARGGYRFDQDSLNRGRFLEAGVCWGC